MHRRCWSYAHTKSFCCLFLGGHSNAFGMLKFSLSCIRQTIVSWSWVSWVICREARAAAGEEINVPLSSEQTAREEAMKNQTGINGEGLGCQFASLESSFLIKHSFSSHEVSNLEPNIKNYTSHSIPIHISSISMALNWPSIPLLVALALEWSCWQIPSQSVLQAQQER